MNDYDWAKIIQKDNWGYCSRKKFYNWLINEFDLNNNSDELIKKCTCELHHFVKKEKSILIMLNHLALNYELIIATNGGLENQMNKLKASGLLPFFKKENIFISGKIGLQKPKLAFFQYIENSFEEQSRFIMIGDDPTNDIIGAIQANWSTIWVSYNRKIEVEADFKIKDLLSLESCLETIIN